MKTYFGTGTWQGVKEKIDALDKLPCVIYNSDNIPVGFDFCSDGERVKSVSAAKYMWAFFSVFWDLPNDVNDAFNFAKHCGVSESATLFMIQLKFHLTPMELFQLNAKQKG